MDFEQAVQDFYTSILRPGDIAIDCGAHTGRHTRPMLDLVGHTGHVYAFEPLPGPISALADSVAGKSNITLHNSALGMTRGRASFVHVPDFPEYSGFRERIYHDENLQREKISVMVERLDDEVPTIPLTRYIKVDAEGGDLGILRGGEHILSVSRPYVTFECGDNSILNYDYTSADYFDFFHRLGYRITTILGGEELDRGGFVESNRVQSVWDYIAWPTM
ncbi:FkbM family methyltransferase [Mesorhizobium sp. B2-1-3A]|uniref:FkbM family methyltransferase n=1 Tax=Mesorhizobium sp. B2-1-3A TaxID=2589971 RepID=UPI00112CD198|nr:FkbM family methyltransferase [Mesorhizobium sp. B2-1-3A]TPM96488.1 FkbM family methyltransferase [Mesorhizobium sp. B2-1-3A]